MSSTAPFSEEKIKQFVTAWYVMLDVHASSIECRRFLAEDVEMIWPEKTFEGLADFKVWYTGGTYSDGTQPGQGKPEQGKGVIDLYFDEQHTVLNVEAIISGDEAELRVAVDWQARQWKPPAAKSTSVSMSRVQIWRVRQSPQKAYGMEIVYYNAIGENSEQRSSTE